MGPVWLVPGGFGYNVSTLQLLLTIAIGTFDVVVVWFGVWIPMRRAVAPEDRAYLWRGIAGYAKGERERAELERKMRSP